MEAHQLANDLALTSALISEKEAQARNYHYDLDSLYDEVAAAALLGVSPRALQSWRQRGGGPGFVRISSRCIRYRRKDLIAWAEARLRSSTSDTESGVARARSK